LLKSSRAKLGQVAAVTADGNRVDAHAGEYIIAVDGKPTNTMTDIYQALLNTQENRSPSH